MIKVDKSTTKRLLSIHGWSGVLLGLAIYIVIFTGAIVVFSHEIGAWSVSGKKVDGALAGKVDQTLMTLSQEVDPEYLHDVSIWQNSAGYIIAFFHTHVLTDQGEPTEKGTRFVINPETMQVISRDDGLLESLPVVRSSYLEDFFIDLHIRLHAPDPFGLYLTGILGLVLLISAISGFILHRHLIKDIFLSPRLSTRLLNRRDRHNLAGTWGIIFSVILAFTGAFFSFATTLGLPVIAMTAFGGDQQKAMEVILGEPSIEDATPQRFIGFESIIKKAQKSEIAGSVPIIITVEHLGRADAIVTTIHSPQDDSLFFSNHQFSGTTGEYLGEKPTVGNAPSLGSRLIGLMGVLHFGWFAGLLSKIIWLSLGLATCYVTLTGLQLWVGRREKEPTWQQFGRWISIIGYGTPIAMCGAAMGFMYAYSRVPAEVESWTINLFLMSVMVSVLVGLLMKNNTHREKTFQFLLGGTLIALPVMRSIMSEFNGFSTLVTGNDVVVTLDITFMIAGSLFLLLGAGIRKSVRYEKEYSKEVIEVKA